MKYYVIFLMIVAVFFWGASSKDIQSISMAQEKKIDVHVYVLPDGDADKVIPERLELLTGLKKDIGEERYKSVRDKKDFDTLIKSKKSDGFFITVEGPINNQEIYKNDPDKLIKELNKILEDNKNINNKENKKLLENTFYILTLYIIDKYNSSRPGKNSEKICKWSVDMINKEHDSNIEKDLKDISNIIELAGEQEIISETTSIPDSSVSFISVTPSTTKTSETSDNAEPSANNSQDKPEFVTIAFIVLSVAIVLLFVLFILSLLKTLRIENKLKNQKSPEQIEKYVNREISGRIVHLNEQIMQYINENSNKDEINEINKKINNLSKEFSEFREDITWKIEDIDSSKTTPSVPAVNSKPVISDMSHIDLLASTFRTFAEQILSVYREQSGVAAGKSGSISLLKQADIAFSNWIKEFNITKMRLVRSATGPHNQRMLNFATDLIQKSNEYYKSLQVLRQKTGDSSSVTLNIPSFEEYYENFFSGRNKSGEKGNGHYRELMEGYAGITARELVKNITVVMPGRLPGADSNRANETFRKWILSDLLMFCDYMETFRTDLEKLQPDLSGDLYRAFSDICRNFENFLKHIGITYIHIRTSEDRFSPELHQIARRFGDGQTIKKVEQQGLKWGGEVLRKASVWVG